VPLHRRALTALLAATLGLVPLTIAAAPPASAASADVRITEWEYNGSEFAELTNLGDDHVDLTGWSFDDNSRTPGSFDLSAAGAVAPGESILLTEDPAETFRSAWNLGADVTIIGSNTQNLGRSDEINVYDADGALVDRLTYDDQGTGDVQGPRTDTASAWVPESALGANTASAWVRSTTGDAEGSWLHRGSVFVASPGTSTLAGHPPGNPNGDPGDPQPPTGDVLINEVKTNPNPDFVELKNVSDQVVEVSDLTVSDSNHSPVAVTTESTSLQPGGLYSFDPDAIDGGFGLGSADSVTIYLADGTTVVDTYSWTSHRIPSYGRCPGADGLVENPAASPGAPNVCQPVRINEVESSGGEPGDWVELRNVTAAAVDVSGWVLRDDDDSHGYAIPAGTAVEGGDHLVLEEADLGFGLGGADSARLFGADGTTLVDSYAWSAHAATTYGRCPDGTGDFGTTRTPTKGAANDCPPPFHGVPTEPWPGPQEVVESDRLNAFVSDVSAGDVSGLAFDPDESGVLWAIKNKNRLFKLAKVDGLWAPVTTGGWATGKELRFADGNGEPDTEGVTVGPDGAIYATSERDNTSNNVPRNAVLRYDPNDAGSSLTATDEWDLTADFPELGSIAGGSNLGFEGLTWVPDEYLVAGGFADQSTGAAYDPADYPGHGAGLYFLALENDGRLYAYALGADGSSVRVAVVPSGFPSVMEAEFDPQTQRVWAVCDDTCDGQMSMLALGDDGHFTIDTGHDRPTGMPNLNNEGFAIAPQETCVDGLKEVVWSDDAGTGGHSLRSAQLPCATPGFAVQTPPSILGKAMIGRKLTADPGTWTPTPETVDYQWLADGTPIAGATGRRLRIATAGLVGRAITVQVTASAAGHEDRVATSAPTAPVQKGGVALRRTVKPQRPVVRKTRVKVVVRVVNPDGVLATGKVRVNAKGIRARTSTLRGGRVTVRLPVFRSTGRKKLVIRYLGSPLLKKKQVVAYVRVRR
jgi:hypothetical protein